MKHLFKALFILLTITVSSIPIAAHSTKLNGTSYSRVYDYTYYTKNVHPEVNYTSLK